MALYTRHQLVLLLVLLGAAGGGLAIERWRTAHPELAERLERFDHAAAGVAAPPPASRRPPDKLTTPSDGSTAVLIDPNRAAIDELARLPGVGPVLAARIVEAREREGPFSSVDDLRRVRGLGRAKLERLRIWLAVELPAADP